MLSTNHYLSEHHRLHLGQKIKHRGEYQNMVILYGYGRTDSINMGIFPGSPLRPV